LRNLNRRTAVKTTYTTYTYTSKRGNSITVSRPILTEEEKARRMEEIKKATVRLILATEKEKARIHRRKTS
jgi:hypothetical protein